MLSAVEGSLTISLHSQPEEADLVRHVLRLARRRAGRILGAGVPTGLAVTWATHHGGPWPATTAPLHTSVGAYAIRRFLRPVAYQDIDEAFLPPELADANPVGLMRRVDGRLTREPVRAGPGAGPGDPGCGGAGALPVRAGPSGGAVVRAAVLRAPGRPVRVEDIDLEPPHAGEVLVRVEAAGVCHTELHYMSGDIPCPLPIVLGHEGTGVVEEVGAGVDDVAPGHRVAFTWRPRCGQCEYCVTGRPVMCVYGRVQARSGGLMDGTSRLRRGHEEVHHFLGVSCFAEYAVVSRRAVVRLPADIPAEIAAVAGCAVVTGVGAVVNVAAGQGSVAGRPLLVLGAGGVGLSAVMGAHLVGAAPVVVVDVAGDKLDLAQRLGATDVVDATQVPPEELVARLQSLTGGGAEVAIDAVGSPATMAQAFAALRPGGLAIAVGLASSAAAVPVPINELVQQQKRLVGCLYGSANPGLDLPRLLGLYGNGRLPLDKLLGATYSLEDVGKAYDELRAGAVGRAIVVPAAPVAGPVGGPVPVPVAVAAPTEAPGPHRS